MNIGKLNQPILLQRPISVQGPDGSKTPGWEDVATVWAAVLPIGGREAERSNQIVAVGDTRIKMRWSTKVDAINATWRILHGSKIFNIKAPPINAQSANTEIELICESGVNNG